MQLTGFKSFSNTIVPEGKIVSDEELSSKVVRVEPKQLVLQPSAEEGYSTVPLRAPEDSFKRFFKEQYEYRLSYSNVRKQFTELISDFAPGIEEQAYVNLLASFSSSISEYTRLPLLNIGPKGTGKDQVTTRLLVSDGRPKPPSSLNKKGNYVQAYTYFTPQALRDKISLKYAKGYCILMSEMNTVFKGEASATMVEIMKQMLDGVPVRTELKGEGEIYVENFTSGFIGNLNTLASSTEDYRALISRALVIDFQPSLEYLSLQNTAIANRFRTSSSGAYSDAVLSKWRAASEYGLNVPQVCGGYKIRSPDAGIDLLRDAHGRMARKLFSESKVYLDPRDHALAQNLAVLDGIWNEAFTEKSLDTKELVVPYSSYKFAKRWMEHSVNAKMRYILNRGSYTKLKDVVVTLPVELRLCLLENDSLVQDDFKNLGGLVLMNKLMSQGLLRADGIERGVQLYLPDLYELASEERRAR